MDVEVLKHLERGKVVSTRIEPPLHPMARESIERLWYRTEELNELELLQCVSELKSENKPITNGIFAVGIKMTSRVSVVMTHFTHHNQKRTLIYSIDSY